MFLFFFNFAQVINLEQKTSRSIAPTAEGKSIIENGSYEFNLYQNVPVDTGIDQPSLMVKTKTKTKNVYFFRFFRNLKMHKSVFLKAWHEVGYKLTKRQNHRWSNEKSRSNFSFVEKFNLSFLRCSKKMFETMFDKF